MPVMMRRFRGEKPSLCHAQADMTTMPTHVPTFTQAAEMGHGGSRKEMLAEGGTSPMPWLALAATEVPAEEDIAYVCIARAPTKFQSALRASEHKSGQAIARQWCSWLMTMDSSLTACMKQGWT